MTFKDHLYAGDITSPEPNHKNLDFAGYIIEKKKSKMEFVFILVVFSEKQFREKRVFRIFYLQNG